MDFSQSLVRKRIKNIRHTIVAGILCLSMQQPFSAYATQQQTTQLSPAKPTPAQVAAEYIGPKGTQAIDFWPKYPKLEIKADMNRKLIKRGEYLVKMGDCIACHTNTPEHGKPFAGGLAIDTPFGTFFTPNITPDKETGIGKWNNEDFIRAMHEGINPQGKYYFPVFPYTTFTKVSKQDLIAIKAYLDALEPVHQVNKKTTAPWPFSWRFTQLFWRTLFFKAGYFKYDPEKSVQWNRGRYIVDGLGHCTMCHTPLNPLGAMKTKYYLTGTFIDGFWAPDITGEGLITASKGALAKVFSKEELINKAGPVRGPMAEVDHDSLQYMTEADLQAIAVYLKSVKSVQPRVPKISPAEEKALKPAEKKYKFDPATLKVGKKVYDKVCAICHDKGMAGAPKIYATANWTLRLEQGGLPQLYKNTIDGYNQMPPKGACITCSENDIKAAVDYIIDNSQDPAELKAVAGAKAGPPDTSLKLGEQVYEKVCSVCHNDGHLGAQKLGDKAAWKPLLKKNIDVLIRSTVKGKGNMPAMGGCKECNKSDIIAAVKYMAQKANPKGDYSLW